MSPEPVVRPGPRSIFLVGFMGSGKSTVGRLVASDLEWGFVDTDELIVRREGRSIDRIFGESGEGVFRRLEWEALETLDGRQRLVVSTGGGLFCGVAQRRWMRSRGATVWLDAPFAECVRRVGDPPPDRPLWAAREDPEAFRALFEKRRAVYALADLRIAASGAPDRVARELLRKLRPLLP